MNRDIELRFLLPVLLVNCMAFFLLDNAFKERGYCAISGPTGTIELAPYMMGDVPTSVVPAAYVALYLLFHAFMRQRLPGADPYILPVAAFVSGIGLVVVTRLAPDLAIFRNSHLVASKAANGVQNVELLASLGWKQALSLVVGVLTAIFTVVTFDSRWFSTKKYLWGLVCIVLSLITLAFGRKINGAKAWIGPFQFIEITKLLIILLMAGFIHERGKAMEAVKRRSYFKWFGVCGPLLLIFAAIMLPIHSQRMLGPCIVILAVSLLIFQVGGAKKSFILTILLMATLFLAVAYRTGYGMVQSRFLKYLDPFGRDLSATKALWAISSGGLWGSGRGIGYGQSYQIPEVQSDYIPSVICEEFGLLVALAMLVSYGVFAVRCLKIAAHSRNSYQQILVLGIAALFVVQSTIVWAGNLAAIPFTGLTFPLGGSYGGNSTVMTFAAMGIVLKISGDCHEC